MIRRSLLTEFELDERMSAYYADNEWCYRVSRDRPDAFRRCRQALAIHHLGRRQLGERTPEGRALTVRMLTAHARFYERHGLLLAPWLYDVVPAGCRARWTARAISPWRGCYSRSSPPRARLDPVGVARWRARASVARRAAARAGLAPIHRSRFTRLRPKALSERLRDRPPTRGDRLTEETLAFLHQRYETLCRMGESRGVAAVRDRLRPALRFYEAVRGAGQRQAASDRRSLAPMQTADAPFPRRLKKVEDRARRPARERAVERARPAAAGSHRRDGHPLSDMGKQNSACQRTRRSDCQTRGRSVAVGQVAAGTSLALAASAAPRRQRQSVDRQSVHHLGVEGTARRDLVEITVVDVERHRRQAVLARAQLVQSLDRTVGFRCTRVATADCLPIISSRLVPPITTRAMFHSSRIQTSSELSNHQSSKIGIR